jgi:hypothetical protein
MKVAKWKIQHHAMFATYISNHDSMENVPVWKDERLKDICHHVEGPNLRGFEIIIFFFTET